MPNWCHNELEIWSDSKEKLEALIANDRFFENVVPIGEWDWDKAITSWGTKWDLMPSDLKNFEIYEVDEKAYKFKLRGYMDTAWAPPIGIYNALMEQGFDVCAAFIEYGCDFCGMFDSGAEFIKDGIPPSKDPFWNTGAGRFIDDHFDVVLSLEEWEEEQEEE